MLGFLSYNFCIKEKGMANLSMKKEWKTKKRKEKIEWFLTTRDNALNRRGTIWIGNFQLKEIYSNLYTITSNRRGIIDLNFKLWIGGGVCDLKFSRNLNDGEVKELVSLLNQLRDYRPSPRERGSKRWTKEKGGKFTVKSFCSALGSSYGSPFPHKSIFLLKRPFHLEFGHG